MDPHAQPLNVIAYVYDGEPTCADCWWDEDTATPNDPENVTIIDDIDEGWGSLYCASCDRCCEEEGQHPGRWLLMERD